MKSLHRTLILGANSAIAQAVARKLVASGYSVYCVARNQLKLQALLDDLNVRGSGSVTITGEVADLNQIELHESLFENAYKALGGLDAVLIAHGTLPNQADCQAAVDITLEAIHTNALSTIALMTEAANRFERQGQGVIATISSVAGDRGRQSNYVYGAAKGMVTIFMQGLRNRLLKKGVAVVTIKPGFVDTPMTAAFEKKGVLWAKPEKVASDIVNAMRHGYGEVYSPGFWLLIMMVIRHIPSFVFNRLSL